MTNSKTLTAEVSSVLLKYLSEAFSWLSVACEVSIDLQGLNHKTNWKYISLHLFFTKVSEISGVFLTLASTLPLFTPITTNPTKPSYHIQLLKYVLIFTHGFHAVQPGCHWLVLRIACIFFHDLNSWVDILLSRNSYMNVLCTQIKLCMCFECL